MPRRGDNIRKRKDGRWEARYIRDDCDDPSKKYGSVYGKTYQEAKEKRDLMIMQGQQQKPSSGGLLFRDLLDAWQDANRVRLKEASISRYQNLIDTHILPELGNKRINQINASAINRFLSTKLEKGRIDGEGGLSASYVRSISLVIGSAIRYGVSEKMCDPLFSPITKPTLPKKALSVLSIEKQRQLEQELLDAMNEEKLLVYITLYSGLRIGEVCALRWEDISLESKLIYVRQTVSRVWYSENGKKRSKLIVGLPKTESSQRCIPICSKLYAILNSFPHRKRHGYVLPNNDGGFISPRTFEYRYPLGTVSTYTGGTITGNGTANVEVLVENTTLQWVAANSLRAEGWWVGIDVVAPAYFNQNAQYKVKTGPTVDFGEAKSFADYKDGEKDIQLWFPVSPESLNKFIAENRNLTMTYAFDWNGDDTYEQTIVFSVKPSAGIVLKKGDVQHYPAVGTINPLTGGTVTGNGTANVEVVIYDTTLQWSPADTSIGRNQDGWWVGIDVVAPDHVANNASYKVKSNPTAEYGAAKSFADYKDGEKNIQLWFPVSPESLKKFSSEGRYLTMTYAFDWDGNGDYEQTIVFSVNPDGSIKLMKDTVKYYPELGSVSTYTGGTVTGNKTSDVSVIIEDTVLQWSPADPSIGRNQDGWWVGIKVTVPENYEPVLMGAKYQTKSNPNIDWNDITEVKSFWDNKDDPYYIQLWFPVTPASLEKFKNENRNITMMYRFDWEGDGEYDQTITFSVVPSDKIVLTKVEQTGFAFVEPNPVDKWVGESYTNTASGGKGTGTVTYTIIEGADVADIDATTGKLTFKKVGTVTVRATKAADDTYKETTATYTVKAIKYPQAEFKFENSNTAITVGFVNGFFTNTATGGSGEGAVTYSIISGESVATIDTNTGKVTFIKAGDVTVVATKQADGNYLETTATYTLTIEKSEQQPLDVTHPDAIIYNPNAQDVFNVADNNCGNGEITYTIVEGSEFATIDASTGKITTTKAGTIKVQIDKAGDDGYNAATPYVATIEVLTAEQKDFAFADKTPSSVTFNDNSNKFSNVAAGGQSTGEITYAFADAESDEIADINVITGEITILASGTVKVVATKAGDDCYKPITAEYTLKIEKDTPEFTVGDVQLVYGATEHQINVNTVLAGSGKYVYSIEGENNIGAAVDQSGKITFENSTGKVGTITIKVKKEADNQYVEAEKTFTLTVSYHQPSAQPTVSGDTKNESGWYTGIVTIHAPEGYQISYSNELAGTVWSDTVTVNTDGDNAKNVYLKKGNEITNAISFESIKIDTVAPVDVDIKYENSFWETFLASISFGIYQADEVTVTLTATDLTSGVDYFTYNIGGEDIVVRKADFTENENGVAKYEFNST